jgi:CO dehydrogenase/acetyl-CoA synthase epsilon subunit
MCAYLLIWMADKGHETFETVTFTGQDKNKTEQYLTKFREYAATKTDSLFAQFVFHKREQLENESVENFITELKRLVKPCAYTNPDKRVRDCIVMYL